MKYIFLYLEAMNIFSTKKEQNEVINEKIGYPYDTIPKGYPNKIKTKQIERTISKVLDHLKQNNR